ncbi:titin-like isoform X1 [Montipora capricornis]|uniref:titin-like isoform X1 n=1 Tax=Montipora capricornis TaxID=246305 RepID=UPI0035F1A435
MEKSDLQRFRNECVAAHNFYRASHGTPPLCWSARLAESAQNWAEQLASTTTGSLRYSSVKGFGENLACLWGSELNGQKVTRIWYEEGQYFDYGSTRVTSRTRSFCQVIWQGTRELGAGAAVTENGKQIIVARYFPPLSKKDVARNVKIPRSTRDGAQPLAYDTRWSRLYVGLKEFHEECLSVHNEYRIRHGAAPLHWSAELAWEAQQWAENLARIGELRHNDDDTVGENLAGMTGGELTGREAVDMWYEEIENYNFDCHGYSEDTSNFTQVIWVASENLGVGRAMEGDLCVVVAFYEPPGNVEGSFSNNVLRMGSAVRKRNSKGPKSFIPPPPDFEGFRLECLVTHNYFRARHGSPPLVLNNALTDEAQYWAERLLVTGATEGLDNSRIGISVAVLESKHVSGIKVSELWYKQILCYNFDSPGFSTETLDFSQLVWMSSRKFGVGKATGPEGVTVVVARYEPVGNIDGLFVQNVKRRGHERGSCEPMIFQVEYKYRFRTDSKSTNSVLSWEHEEAPALICDGDVTKASYQAPRRNGLTRAKFLLNRLLEDLDRCRNSCSLSPPLTAAGSLSWSDVDQIDENKNIVPRPDEEEPSSSLTVSDAFTRLVWIDPNSPTLQRKGVAEETAKEELDDDDDDADDEGEDEDYAEKVDQDEDGRGEECDDVENAKMVYEQENRAEGVDCVSEEPYLQTEEPQLEEADLFSDPEDDLYHRVCEVRRSLSLDSEGTEPETQPGNVLSKVAFFETFQRTFEMQSPSNSQSSFRRSLIQDKLEELDSTSEPELSREKEEGEERQEHPQQEHDEPECQLEFDDLFPAHMEGDEGEIREDMFEDEAGEDEESLVSVSDAEDIVDFAYYDDRPEDVQDYELEDTYCQTNEFIEEESCTMEIFEFSDEDASHQYSDIIDTEDEPILLTRRVVTPLNSGAAAEFLESQSFEVREAEPQDSIDDSPHDYPDELHDTSEATVEVPQTLFTRTLDPEHCYATTKGEEIDIRLRELISKIMLIPVDDRPGGSDELSDFGETMEGQLLQNIFSRTEDGGLGEKRTPIEETCEASQKRIVESEKDFVELLARLQREEVKCDKVESDAEEGILKPSKEIQRPESAEIICATLRDHKSELHDKMERVSSDLGLEPAKYLEEERLDGRAVPENVILAYESQLSLAVDDVEPVTENVEAVEREHKNESASDPERLLERMQSPTQQEEFAQGEIIISDVSESSRSVESYEVAIRDHHQERDRLLDEIGLVPISPDINLAGEEMLEPLPYEHTPILKFRELPEVKEDITAEVRGDVRCELNVKSEENENEYVSLTAETFQDSNETIEKQIPCEAVFRDHDQERALNIEEREFQLELRPEVEDPNEPVEPVLYCTAPKSIPESQLPEISENIAAEVRPEVRSEINIEELFLPYEEVATLQGGKLENAQHVDEMKETMTDKQSHESFYVDDTMTDFSSSFPQHVSNESKNCKPAEELKVAEAKLDNVVVSKVEPEEADIDRRASLFEEKNSFVDSITLKEFSERLHVAGETLNVDPTTLTEGVEIDEQTVDEKQGVQFTEEDSTVDYVMTDIPSSSGHIAGECTQNESVEKINEEEYGEFKKPASLFIEEDSMVNALLPDTMSSPKQVSGESKNVESFEEILEEFEPSEESKRTSIFLGDAVTLDEVRTDIESSPKHLAMESRDVEPYQEIIEVTDEENKQASRIVEEVPNVETVRTDRPSSPRHLIMESKELETFEKTDDENTFESKRASLFMEETTIVKEATRHASSFPKHIAGEINNEESFEEVDEIATKESNRISLIVEETMTVGEITTNTKSPPTHLAGERTQNESIDLILEEQCFEGKKRASLFFEEDSSVKEVGASAISSPNQVAGEGKNVENFNEINEEPNEERKRASLFYEEAINEDEILTCTSFSPKQTAEDINNEEIFDEIEQDDTQESKRASLFIEEGVTVDEMITNTSSSRTHGLAGESVNTETFEEVEMISDEEKNQTSVFLEEDVFADEMTPDRTSFAIHTAREDVCIPLVKKTHEKEDEQDLEHADVREDDIEVKFGHTELTCLEQNSHIAGEFLDSGMVEATDDDEPPESVYVEEFEEFENSYGTKSFVEPAEIENIAGEMANVANDAEAFEEDARIEESLGYDENHEIVISTDILETPLNSLHIAGTLSNVEPKEESCEEEKTEKEAFAEKFHELKAHESTVVLKSPQSLLSIAAAAIEHKIDSAQQDSTEEVTMETGLKKQDSKEESAHLQFTDVIHEPYEPKRKEEIGEKALLSEQSPTMFEDTIGTTDAMVMETETKVPIILVNIAAEVSDNEDDNLVFVKKDSEVETETYQYPEEVAMEYHPDDREIAVSQEVAEVSLSELVLEDENLVFAENELNKDSEEETETYEYSEEAATGYVPNGEEISVSHEVAEVSLSELVLEDENLDFAENELKKDSEVETKTYEYPEEVAMEYHPDDQKIAISQEVAEVSLSELVLEDENLVFAENDLNKDSEVETETYEYPEEAATGYVPNDEEIPVSHDVAEVSLSQLVLEDENLDFAENDLKKDSEAETETYEYPEEEAMEYHPDDQEIPVSQEVAEVSLSELVLEDENLDFAENDLKKDSEVETETYEYPKEAAMEYHPNDQEIPVSHEVAEVSLSELVLEDENLDFAENELKKDSEVETKTYEYPEEVAMEYHPDDQKIAISQEVTEVSLSELVLEDENLDFAENDLTKDSEVETETYEYPEEATTGYVPNDEEIPVPHDVAEVSLSQLVLEDENLDFAENDLKKDSEAETETYEYPEEEAMEYHQDDQEIPVSQEVAEVSLSELVLEDENLDFAENDLKKDSEVETETYEYPEEAAMEYHPDDQEIPVSHEVAEVSLSELVLEDENLVFAENELNKDSEVKTETYEYPEEAATGYVPNNEEIPVSYEVAEVSLSELVLEDENLVFAENELKEDSEVETETHEYPEESAMDYLPDDQVISESHEVSEISVSELLEDKNLAFVENELKKDSEVETEKYEYPDEASMEYLPDDQIISESHEVAEVFVSEHILEQKAKVKQRETVEAFEGSEEGSISELLSESSSSPLRVSDELKDLQGYETINEEYDIETYHSINYGEGDTVSEKSISKCLPPLFITEELVLQEQREDNIEEKKVQDHDNLQERSQGPEIPYVSGQSLETATELSDVGFTDYSVKEELNEREFAEEFMDIESVIVETSRKDHLSPQKNEKGVDLLGKVNAQKPEERGNVTIEQSTIESEPTVSAVSREQKEEKIFDYSWQMENKTEEPIVEKAGKREVTKAQKTTTDSENKGTFTEHGLMLPRDEESFSLSQSESLIVSEQGRQIKILHEKEEKVDVFSTRTKQSISHVAAESTSRTLEYNFESHSACIFRQVATSDKLSESILDKETKDQELEKYEKEFSEEETEVRLLKNEVLECKVAEQQLPTSLGNPHAIVERETTLVKTLVTRSPSKDDQEEVLLREDRLTAILKDDEAMLEQESAVEHFEEEIDVMRMDEALSEEEFRGEGAESIDREQSRPSRSDSVEEDDTCNESEAGVEDKRNLNEAEKDDAGNFQGAAEDVVYESDANSLMKTSVLDEEVEVKVFEEGGSLVEENREIVDENETRTETPVFEEELDVSALPTEKDIIYAECTEEDSPVDRSAVFEEEVEVSALPDEPIEELEVESFAEREEEDVDRTAVYEEELEITACKTQLEQEIQERESDNQVPKVEEGCEITGSQVHEERTNEENLMDEHEDSLTNESEAGERLLEKEDIGEKSDDEGTLENLKIRKTRKQPLDLSQVDFYDEDESATATRYYVEFSSTESLEPSYEEVDEDEAPFSETYVRQGEPLEENLEEFILVRYGDEFESSGEEDISDHREIYVIPEEENDIENHNIAETTTDEAHAKRPAPETLYEDEFENMGLGEIRESPEFDIDDSDELDEEEQRQLEEYERLESFVILEEKLSQVESDEDGNGDIPLEEDDENVFYSDVHSSGEETLHEDELGETLTTGSLRQTAAFTEKDEAPLGRDCTQMEEQDCGEQQETLQECSPETKEPVTMTGFSDSQEPVKVSPDDPGTTKDSEIEIVTEAPEDNKENFELRNTKEEKAEHSLSSDSSGEQCMSAEGSVSSTTSLDLEGLDSFEQECLLQHNLYRRQHKVKPLKWSEELAEGAKKWAEHLASMKSLESFEGKEVGENITSMQGKELNGCETADLWYKEAMDYNFEDPAFNAKCGRFTQVVWASSREFGVAKCIAEDGTEYIVARYKPAGNILGEFKDNVKPPRDTLKRRRSSVRRRSKSGAHLTPAEKEKFKTECVVSHNYYRTFHDAPPLRWSPLLAAEAQNYAERLAKTDSLTHSGQKDRGENLAFTWDIPLSAREAIDMWYDEVQDYDFENPGFTYDTGHFTQLIWVGTEEFGMGMTVAPDGKNIVVGRYFPPGNVVGQFKENVRPREIEAIP